VNGDGDSDCVDYTLQFYDNYSPRGELRIMWNYNPAQDFNHLFVTVRGMGIEAGAYVNPTQGTKWFGIEKYWGSQYDPHYNKDVTAYVDSIRKGVFTWSR
jgi:hypothetical protein